MDKFGHFYCPAQADFLFLLDFQTLLAWTPMAAWKTAKILSIILQTTVCFRKWPAESSGKTTICQYSLYTLSYSMTTYSIKLVFIFSFQYSTVRSSPFCFPCPEGGVLSGFRGDRKTSPVFRKMFIHPNITSVLWGRLQRFMDTFWASTPKQSTTLRLSEGRVLVRLIKLGRSSQAAETHLWMDVLTVSCNSSKG